MTRIADLHMHSTASDGQYTPSELVRLAKERDIAVMALTDHDTTEGTAEAETAAQKLGVRFIRGVELSAMEYPTFHILGYAYEPGDTPLLRLCHRMKRVRDERGYRILDYLHGYGIELEAEEVEAFAGGKIVGRPHFAQAMVKRGYVANNREAFDRFLDTPDYHAKCDEGKPPVRECIDAIKTSGGKVSLAHPYQIGLDDTALEAQVRELTDMGLDAIECYYPRHTPEMTAFYLGLARKYDLRVTGGSDFHGEKVKPDIGLATLEMDVDWLMGE